MQQTIIKETVQSRQVLLSHQQQSIEIALSHPRWGFWHEPGTGKTRIMIEAIQQLDLRTLIVAPLSILEAVWEEEFARWAPTIKVINLWKTPREGRKEALLQAQVVIVNYDTFRTMEKEISPRLFEILIVDESAKCKGRTTHIARALTRFSRAIPRCYLLSGCPCPNSELEWYPQMNILAPGLLGSSYWAFRNTFFYPYNVNKTLNIVYEWRLKDQMRGELIRCLKTCSSFLRKQDCLNLPPKTFLKRQVFLSQREWIAYERLRRDLLLQLSGSTILAANALTQIMKLRELTSGFAHPMEEQPPVRFGDSKLQELLELLEEIGSEQVIIWTHFKEEARQIKEALGEKSEMLTGDVPMKDREEHLKRWRSREIRYLICHPAAAGHGLTLVESSHAVYFSMSHSLELWIQSQDRQHRMGQSRAVTYHVLEAVGPHGEPTIDHDIWGALQAKDVNVRQILNGLRRRG